MTASKWLHLFPLLTSIFNPGGRLSLLHVGQVTTAQKSSLAPILSQGKAEGPREEVMRSSRIQTPFSVSDHMSYNTPPGSLLAIEQGFSTLELLTFGARWSQLDGSLSRGMCCAPQDAEPDA